MLEEQNEAMFTEYAETIVRYIQINPIQDDTLYYALLKCPFVSI